MPDFAEQIGLRIREVRHQKAITQDQLSRNARVTRAYLSQIENGKYWMRIDTLEAICRGLGVKPWELLQGIEIEGPK
jgi:transcriptional regulator with XRE-family HTH domain